MIHKTAIVSATASLADDVEVGPYTVIGDGVELGPGCRIGSHVVINGPTRIGRDTRIFQFASIGDDPQDKKYAGQPTRLEIGDRNTIREYCTINRGTADDEGVTRVGDDNWLMAYVHIAHDCQVGNHTVFANCATIAGHCSVGDYTILGGFTGVHQFSRIGEHCFLGMFSAVNRDVPSYVTVFGQPAEPRGVNTEGLKRRGFSNEQIRNIRTAYRTLYRSNLKLAEAIEKIEACTDEQPELITLVASLKSATRSIVR